MKRYASLLIAFALVLAALLLGGCSSSEKSSEGLEYTLIDGSYYEVSGIGTCTDTEIYIPAEYNGLPVKSIGKGAFYLCSSLTGITIPDSITSIGSTAFLGCSSLTYNVHDNAKYLGNKQNPYMVLIKATDTSITSCEIHAQTKIIVDGALGGAFNGCSSLTSITIPDSVTSIGREAFYDCSSLTSVTVGNSVTSIGDYAFSGCSSLTGITIPDSVISIGEDAFGDCSSLTYNVYDNAKYLGNEQNPYLALITATDESITGCEIHAQTKVIGENPFSGCKSLTDITVAKENQVYHSNGNCLIKTASKTLIAGCSASIIPTDGSVTSIGKYAFYGCKNLTDITIPDSVTSIGDHAFNNCDSLEDITIPDSVTSIGVYAFFECSSLTSVTIGNSVTSIGVYAFFECSSLTSVTIGNSVTSIGDYAFGECWNLKIITFTGTQAQWDSIPKKVTGLIRDDITVVCIG